MRLHYDNPFAPIQSLYAGVLQVKPVSTRAAGNFCKVSFDRALNRPRSPEVRKPLAYFWFFLHNTKSTKNVPFRRKLRGFANLESAHRSRSFAPQQLKPFKEESRFFKPRISALKQQIRTNQLNPFETIQGLSNLESAYSSKNFPTKTFH